mmetsp:Transcript_39284/g.65871  ORF Transcript_39284/g.65871 Transcript_39284/m.65871 type:complete len:218 (+) Transcript_39284:166-819(+)
MASVYPKAFFSLLPPLSRRALDTAANCRLCGRTKSKHKNPHACNTKRVAFTFKDNICPTKPCANGGDCSFNAQVGSYTCFCHCGYRGANCTINPPGTCSEYSCGQRGKCVTESRKRGRLRQNTCTFTRCQCEVAWMRGYGCEQDWSKCYTNGTFCGGNGRCKRQQSDDSYCCNCYEGFTGPQCLEKVLKKSSISSSENFLFNFAKILLGIILFGNPR